MTKVDIPAFRRSLINEMKRLDREGIKNLRLSDRVGIGEDVIESMKELISKGISPIAGNGRFEGYKAVTRSNRFRKNASQIKGKTDKAKRARRNLRIKANAAKKGYPYNVMNKYPGKKVRPVNLELSGDFLKALEARPRRFGVNIGFFKSWAADYEDGHRVGWNGQPKRPIIPNQGEEFNAVVFARLIQSIRFRLIPRLEKVAKRSS